MAQTIYITGATGFVGKYVVSAALDAGNAVKAVVRPSSKTKLDAGDGQSLEQVRVDLRSRAGLVESLADVDVVIHLAAAKAGDFATQFAGTVVATENLLAAMTEANVSNLVGVSTFSVYDYLNTASGTLIDESSPVDTAPELRDEYARTKLLQEDLYRSWGAQEDNNVVILRPGMIYGPDNLWHALLGAEVGPKFMRIGAKATLPLAYVENCANAMVKAAEMIPTDPALASEVINIVDDDLPTQAEYAEIVQARIDTPDTFFVPWPVLRGAAASVKAANRHLLGGRAKFPGIAVPDRLHARFKALRYTNAKAKRLLSWTPTYTTKQAVERSVKFEQDAKSASTSDSRSL